MKKGEINAVMNLLDRKVFRDEGNIQHYQNTKECYIFLKIFTTDFL